ncbi:MAG: site-specific integrase, partial [Fibrobacter sp.]|nr:site-specific integrase [Fibrobacter sp.]
MIVNLLALTGARRGEIAGLKWDHIDLENGIITCGASRKRSVPLSAAATKAVSEYITFIRRQMIRDLNEEILFVN